MDIQWFSMFVLSIAALYSSTDFGGASGYLTAMSLFSIPATVMASTALVPNILVSSISFTNHNHAGYLMPKLLVPFLITSVLAAFLGGYMKVSEEIYATSLYIVLTYLALRMSFFWTPAEVADWEAHPVFLWAVLLSGAVIGLLSRMIGMGGGIFLSMLILLMQWGTPKEAVVATSRFIVINSVSGLAGRILGSTLQFGLWLFPAGLSGTLIGSRLGATRFSGVVAYSALGIILTIALSTYWLNTLFV